MFRGVTIICVVVLAPPAWGAASHDAQSSVEQLRGGLLRFQASLRSVCVTYRVPYDLAKDPSLPRGAYIHREIAARGPRSFFKINAHGHDGMDWRNDPILARNIVTRDLYRTEWTNRRTYEERKLAPDELLPEKFRGDFFILATGWWPPDCQWQPPRTFGRPLSVHEVAASPQYSVVRPVLEECDGRWCHVLERAGHDALWIDSARGCAILARELREPTTGALIERYTAGGHREVAAGVWLPGWFESVQFDLHARTEEGRTRVIGHSRATVLEIQANDVSEEVFAFRTQPGDGLANRFTGEWKQTEPGGLDFLDSCAAQALALSTRGETREVSHVGWLAGAPLFIAVLVWELSLRLRRGAMRRASPERCAKDSVEVTT